MYPLLLNYLNKVEASENNNSITVQLHCISQSYFSFDQCGTYVGNGGSYIMVTYHVMGAKI